MPPKEDDSLGQDFTRMGEEESPKPSDTEQSLGDQSTFGDAGSSASDVSDLDDAFDSDMEVVDLSSRYEIEGVLGKGGMGEVLRARDKRLDRPVAIKRVLGEMARSKTALSRFLTEAQSVAKLNHFSIVQIYDYGRATDGPFIIMELVEGQSLQEKLKEGPLDLQAAVDMTCQLCDGLSTAHEAGITHRDIKPANILLTGRGEPKLTDFGLARQDTADHGQTMAGAVLGTIDFMPPEQRRDATQTDARSDLWSLAATLYQMVTGKSPKIIRFNNVPQALQDVLGKALEDEKDDRYQTAAEFRDALRDSLTASAPAPEVAVDLSAGECPQCHEKNEASRKFCKGCGESLRSPCLKCEQEIAVWEKFCPECGVNPAELIETRQTELEQQKQQIESLRREYDYDQALSVATTIKELSDTRFKEYQVWAEEMIQTLATEYAEQGSRRDNLVSEAQVAFDNHRYDDVIKLLDGIAGPLRDDAVTSLLREAQSRQQETQDLLAKIKERVASRDIDGLWEDTARFLELNPGHKQVSDLDQKLQERRQKREKQTVALLERAEAAYVSHQDKEVLGLLAKWPPGMKQPDRVRQLLELSQARDEQATNLRQEIQTAVTAKSFDGVLPKVEEYATLRPYDDSVAQLREQLLGYEESKPPEIIVTKEVSKRPVTGSVGNDSQRNRNVLLLAGGVGGIVLLVFLFAIFSSGRKAADDSVSDARLPTTPSKEPQERESGSPAEGPETPSSTPPKVPIDKPALAAAPLTASEAKQHQQDWAEYLETEVMVSNKIGMQFRLIPPGEFQMGSPASEAGRFDGETLHRVRITKPFYLSAHEVTQEQYERVMGENPSFFSALGDGKGYVPGIETSQFPVENMSWNDAVNFCRKLSAQEGVTYRLPTEAEWEYACRAGTTTAYSSGPGTSELDAIGWYADNSGKAAIDSASILETDPENYATRIFGNGCRPHVVGGKSPNAWGLYDMHGNVYEWCRDWYAAYGSENVLIDPTGPASGDRRVLRGGAFRDQPKNVRAAYRNGNRPANRFNNSGFRLARTYNLSP